MEEVSEDKELLSRSDKLASGKCSTARTGRVEGRTSEGRET